MGGTFREQRVLGVRGSISLGPRWLGPQEEGQKPKMGEGLKPVGERNRKASAGELDREGRSTRHLQMFEKLGELRPTVVSAPSLRVSGQVL